MRSLARFWLRFGGAGGVLFIGLVLMLALPDRASACACGCGVFEVGSGLMHPIQLGGFASFEWDYLDQHQNWSGTSQAPAADNEDKRIRTDFYNLNFQYMFDRKWGLMANVPYWNRYFLTAADDGSLTPYHYSSLGDMRVTGVYSGFSEDMCTGLTFGFKLPTGDYTYPGPDRDNQIGTGSTDTLLGFYHQGGLTQDNSWVWFGQALWDNAIATRNGYRPGDEVDVAAGLYFNAGQLSSRSSIAPVLSFLFSERWRDSGVEADPDNTGFTRLLIAPAIQFTYSDLQLYAQVGFPIYQRMNGNQLVAKEYYKVSLGYAF